MENKAKKGTKPIKFPEALFNDWLCILENYKKTHQEELIPAVVALEKLIASKDAPYDKQARHIKQAAKALQDIPSDQIQPIELQQIQSIVEPIASLGYFAATENLSRRTFVPLIEASVSYSGSSCSFSDYYQQYISHTPTLVSLQDRPMHQKALTVYATIKFPLGQSVVVQHYQRTLQFFVDALSRAQQFIKVDRLDQDQHMNDIQFICKTLLVLMARSLQISVDWFNQILNGLDDSLLAAMIQNLLGICRDTTTFIRECNQVAAMALGAIINLAPTELARDWTLGWFFMTETNEAVETIHRVLGVSQPEINWEGRDPSMVFILRGLVSSLAKDVVLLDIPYNMSLAPALSKATSVRNLHELLFTGINQFCGNANLDASCKVIAFEAMATWLQQTKEIMSSKDPVAMDNVSAVIEPIYMNRLVQYVCDHWDNPIDSIQHKVRSIFELALTTLELKSTFYQQQSMYQQFIQELLHNLISMDWHRKVKYSLLNMMVDKVESELFLKTESRLILKCLKAMDSFVLCPQISFFVLAFLYRRIQDTIPGHQAFNGHNGKIKQESQESPATEAWIKLWALPTLTCLTSQSELLRKNVSSFLLQPLLKVTTRSFWYMMHILQDENSHFEDDCQLRLNAFIAVLKAARGLDIVDGTSYSNQPSSSGVSIETLKQAIYHSDAQVRLDVLGLLCESRKATAQVTLTEMEMLKLFLPLNMNSTAPEFRQQMCAHLSKVLVRLRGNLYSQYRNYKSLLNYAETQQGEKRSQALEEAEESMVVMDQAKSFLYWLLDLIADSLYPGASYQRVATTLRLLSIVCKIYGVTGLPSIEGFAEEADFPFQIPIATPRLSKLLIDTFMNPYDFNRTQALDILRQFPSPLPGLDTQEDAQQLLLWGLDHVVSTRAGESDSGAIIFRLAFSKYVVQLGYDLSPERNYSVSRSGKGNPAHVFTERLLDLLEKQVKVAQSNLLLAAQQHPMHGTLLALQYVFGELDDACFSENELAWQKTHHRVLQLIHATCDTAVPVLSDASPEGNVPSDYRAGEEEEEEDIAFDVENGDDSTGPKHQVILSCCWRAVKEASSLLEVIITNSSASMLSHEDLVTSGELFRRLLTNIRHRGAFSAVYPAYVSLNTRLLTSRDPYLSQLPAQWLQDNLESLTSSNISITRRSAGLPLCILAIVSSEPSVKKELLSRAMAYLMSLAKRVPPEDADQCIDLPQVHAYNIMRTIFTDSKLGTFVLSYASSGFSLAISGFSSHSWAIRNCSVMLFSTLLQRTFGTKKTRDEHSQVNTLTGREFFVRFPDLHPYLLQELNVAVNQLLKDTMAASVHPGLYPILTLLSRMQPSKEQTQEEHILSPFIPLVLPCAASAIYKTREMAARALVPLVTDIVPTIQQISSWSNITQNEMHGRLLQVQFLLRGHLYRATSEEASDFIQKIPSTISTLLEQVIQGVFCPINNALALSILCEFIVDQRWMLGQAECEELAAKHFSDIRSRLVQFSLETIQSDQNENVIGGYLVRETLAAILVTDNLLKPQVQFDSILFLLQDRDYEVRLMFLQKLLDHVQADKSFEGLDSTLPLQTMLVQRTFGDEEHLNCYVLTAKLLMAINPTTPYPINSALSFSLEHYWDRLVVQLNEKRALSVIESVLPLLGALLSQILNCNQTLSLDKVWTQQCLDTWSEYIKTYSQKEITLPLREAVVKSLVLTSVHLFDHADQEREQARVTACLAIAQLLQDDDIDVRQDTASIVSRALGLPAPVHHERALELVHLFLTRQFCQSSSLQAHLIQTLSEYYTLSQVLDNELSQTKALFAKENPNIYKEDLIDVQWANADLNKALMKKQLQPIALDIKAREWIQFIKQLNTYRNFMRYGPFGLTSGVNVFMAMYRTVLYLHLAVDAPIDHDPTLLVGLRDSLSQLKKETIHPLLWSLLRGDTGLYSKIKLLLNRYGSPEELDDMFLLAPDSRKV